MQFLFSLLAIYTTKWDALHMCVSRLTVTLNLACFKVLHNCPSRSGPKRSLESPPSQRSSSYWLGQQNEEEAVWGNCRQGQLWSRGSLGHLWGMSGCLGMGIRVLDLWMWMSIKCIALHAYITLNLQMLYYSYVLLWLMSQHFINLCVTVVRCGCKRAWFSWVFPVVYHLEH